VLTKVAAGLAVFGCVVVVFLAVLSVVSRKTPTLGMVDGRLRPCPETPNCACSEAAESGAASVLPLSFAEAPEAAWARLKDAIAAEGGQIAGDDGDYLWATFRTPLFRFLDDFEARLDREASVIHIRSASRVGHSDLGANAKRIERIRARFAASERVRDPE
jgi:uncharacterized protein (DUF1499 family)